MIMDIFSTVPLILALCSLGESCSSCTLIPRQESESRTNIESVNWMPKFKVSLSVPGSFTSFPPSCSFSIGQFLPIFLPIFQSPWQPLLGVGEGNEDHLNLPFPCPSSCWIFLQQLPDLGACSRDPKTHQVTESQNIPAEINNLAFHSDFFSFLSVYHFRLHAIVPQFCFNSWNFQK